MVEEIQQISKDLDANCPKPKPLELYALCEKREKTIEARDYRKNLKALDEHLLFARPLSTC